MWECWSLFTGVREHFLPARTCFLLYYDASLSAEHKSSAIKYNKSDVPQGVQGLSPGWAERQKMIIAEWRLAASAHKAMRAGESTPRQGSMQHLEPPSRVTSFPAGRHCVAPKMAKMQHRGDVSRLINSPTLKRKGIYLLGPIGWAAMPGWRPL